MGVDGNAYTCILDDTYATALGSLFRSFVQIMVF